MVWGWGEGTSFKNARLDRTEQTFDLRTYTMFIVA